jgi:hypothetical protein
MPRAHRSPAATLGGVLSVSILALAGIALMAAPAAALGVIIPAGDLSPFGAPCTLAVQEINQSRMLSWEPVAGAAFYRVGYVTASGVVGLAELSGTSFEHIGWAANECLEYVIVAYDAGGVRVCSAHVPGVGKCQ